MSSVTCTECGSRKVIRCEHCALNQFATQNGNCRKCQHPFVAPQIVQEVIETVPNPRPLWGNFYFDQALKLLRLGTGMSQNDLARAMDVPRTYISKIENGHCEPTLSSINKLAAGLGVHPYWLVRLASDSGAGINERENLGGANPIHQHLSNSVSELPCPA